MSDCGQIASARKPLMNKRASPGEAYEPTFHEHIANTVTHGIAIIPSLFIARLLVASAYRDLQYNLMVMYGFFTVLLFSASTIYHLCELLFRPHKRFYLHIADRTVIYFFIAASSTPWLTLRHAQTVGTNLKWFVWAFAFFGIAYQLKYHERHKTLETCLYVVVATLPYVGIITMNDRTGLPLMIFGGFIYAIGAVFFKMDGVIPFAHAIWHCHVVLGASIHTYAVYVSLLGADKHNPFPEVTFTE
ncbi:Monocyte to macrophage differentiation factor 2 [Aphelenchoides besseyi]|nr:Monocyte to macrophage differentiation factor 2 [Aphelenchoides besseyi]KAI6208687.1 Monocyte to macrophage differentiation factor 2 [Aphelenchoides besseyi]